MDTTVPFSLSQRFAEVLDKVVELKDVYEVNSILMKKGDEEIEELKHKLANCEKQLESIDFELQESKQSLEREKKSKAILKGLFCETQQELQNTKEIIQEKSKEITEMKDLCRKTKDELEHAKGTFRENADQLAELEDLFFKTLKKLDKVKEENQEKSDQIAALMSFNFGAADENGSVGSYDDDELSEESLNQLILTESKLALSPSLSPIPEENIDEIPDYYDQWLVVLKSPELDQHLPNFSSNLYALSLRISIGSDSKMHEENDDIEVSSETRLGKRKLCKLRSAISAASVDTCDYGDEKNSKSEIKPKKKRQRFNVLFSIAHL